MTAVCLLTAAGARASDGGPQHERLPLQSDFDRCVLRIADVGNDSIQGRLRLQLLVRASGSIYAAFVHSEKGVNDRRLERCLTDTALLWKLPPVALDYSRAYTLSFVPGATEIDLSSEAYWHGGHFAIAGRASVFMPDINDSPEPAPLNVPAAQATLSVAEWARPAEVGIAQLEVRRYAEAERALREALAADRNDPLALRGLSVTLAESGANVREARYLAERLVTQLPQTEASHEAMLRTCLAAADDFCAYTEWNAARSAPDVAPRSRQLSELQPLVEAAAQRLRVAARRPDGCAAEKADAQRALCVVRRCLDEGIAAYVDELSGEAGADLSPQPWRIEKVTPRRMVVVRPVGAHELRWLVKLGDEKVSMQPTNADALHVSLRHSRCGVVPTGTESLHDVARGATISEPVDRLVKQAP